MRLLQFSHDNRTRYGFAQGNDVVELPEPLQRLDLAEILNNDNAEALHAAAGSDGPRHVAGEVTFQPMIAATARVFCVGINYLKIHPIAGVVSKAPEQPTIFLKLRDCFVGHGGRIDYPEGVSQQLDYEGELAVVIGLGGRHISREDAYRHVFGYTILNDGSVRDWQKHSLVSGKNFFHASSCGPHVVTADEIADPMDLDLSTRINGIEVQRTNTGVMLFDIPHVISHISQFTPLRPGDIIATGSPSGAGASLEPPRFLRPGDRIDIEIGGIGLLSNVVG